MTRRLEAKTQSQLMKSFKKQYDFINENFIILLENPSLVLKEYDKYEKSLEEDTQEDIENFWRAMWVYTIVDIVTNNASKQLAIWYKQTYRQFKDEALQLWIDFNVENPYAVEYLEGLETLYLSNFKWSITLTTKSKIIDIIRTGILEQQTPQEVWEQISKLNKNIFSRNRAQLIATREIWKANEVWWRTVVQQFTDKWAAVQKQWLTVNDSRVTPSHLVNQEQWWISVNETFAGTWDDIAPASDNPRCRCTVTYRVL